MIYGTKNMGGNNEGIRTSTSSLRELASRLGREREAMQTAKGYRRHGRYSAQRPHARLPTLFTRDHRFATAPV